MMWYLKYCFLANSDFINPVEHCLLLNCHIRIRFTNVLGSVADIN